MDLYKSYNFIGLLVEHEMVDVTIPTREDIKLQSKQIIETCLKPE